MAFARASMSSWIDKRCACLELRDLHIEAMWSLTEVPLAATVLVFLWALRFKVRRLVAADPDEL
jgi:hypothetical protein